MRRKRTEISNKLSIEIQALNWLKSCIITEIFQSNSWLHERTSRVQSNFDCLRCLLSPFQSPGSLVYCSENPLSSRFGVFTLLQWGGKKWDLCFHLIDKAFCIILSNYSPEGRHGNPLQYSCLENLMDREAWQATVQRVAESQTTEGT